MASTKSAIKSRLNEWHLKRVPFPAVPFVEYFNEDPLRNGAVFAPELRAEPIEQIRNEILRGGFANMVRPWSWIWAKKNMGGNLGMGKTALLTYLTDQINKDYGHSFFKGAAHWLAVYIPVYPKMKSVEEIASVALASMCSSARGMSAERLLLARIRRKAVITAAKGRYSQALLSAPDIKFTKDAWLEDNGVDLPALSTDVERILRDSGARQQFSHAFASGGLERVLVQLNGDSLLIPARSGLTNRAIDLLLDDVACAVRAAELQHMSLFLDNFYYLVRATRPIDRPQLAKAIRDLVVDGKHVAINKNLYNWVAVMHTKTAPVFSDAWGQFDMDKVAPLDQFAASSVQLRALPLSDGRAMLETYLAYQRPNRAPSKIYPFTSEALDMIVSLAGTQGHAAAGTCEPRSLLLSAWEVTAQALQDGPPTPLGPDYVYQVLTGKPLPAAISTADDEAEVTPGESPMNGSIVCTCPCHADENTPAHDVIALTAGTDEQPQQRITGYRCGLCNMPLANIPVAVSSR
jgi:hypothetical protein